MSIRTDLAVEAVEFAGEQVPEGVVRSEEERNGVKITRVEVVDEASARQIGKPIGKYVTVSVPSFERAAQNYEDEITAISEEIAAMLPKEGLVLVVGLGNNDITPDALGPKTIDHTLATRHISSEMAKSIGLEGLRSAAAIAPGVLGQTGIETAEIILSLTDKTKPAAVVVIDALASKSIDRLGTTVQISNTGIAPGAGVQNKRKEVNQHTLGMPVIAIGVPTVVDMSTIAHELSGEGQNPLLSAKGETMMVTPREIDVIIEKSARTLSLAINKALQPSLSIEDITALVS